jgi:hypothetical protein
MPMKRKRFKAEVSTYCHREYRRSTSLVLGSQKQEELRRLAERDDPLYKS